jgi:rhomboid protease GluP
MISDEHFEFFHTFWVRRTPLSKAFLAINIIVFVLMAFAGGSTNETTLMAFGVKSNAAIAEGEWWRFITPIFIHIGLLHLLFNSYALWMVGPQVEKLYGSASFVILYVVTGIAGVVGSYVYHPYSISAGASGAIFGLFGVLLVFGIRYRNSIPPDFKRAVGTGVLPVIAINLIIGFTIPAIDNSAHIAGLISGALLALVVPFHKPGTRPSTVFTAVEIGLLLLAAVSFYQVVSHYNGPRLSVRNLSLGLTQFGGGTSSTQEFINALNDSQNAFENSSRELDSENPNASAAKTEVTKAIDRLRDIPSLAARADQLTAEMLSVMQEQYALAEDVERSGRTTLAHDLRLKKNTERYEKVMNDIIEWVNTEGHNYGIQMGKPR